MRAWAPADVVISHLRPDVYIETRKKPLPGVPTIGVFGPPMSKFVFARLAWMVCSEDKRDYTGSGGISLRPICCYSCYRHLVCNRGYKQVREEKDPKSLVKGVNGCWELDRCLAMCSCHALMFRSLLFFLRPLHEVPYFPFYRRRESVGYRGGKVE